MENNNDSFWEKIIHKDGDNEYLIILNYDWYEIEVGLKKPRPGVIPVFIQRYVPEIDLTFTITTALTVQFKNAGYDWKKYIIEEYEHGLKTELKRKLAK